MPPVARQGDGHTHGGAVMEGSPNVQANGLPVARVGDRVHCNQHGTQTIVAGSGTVRANGRAVARHGDAISCGATLISTSNVVAQ